ncbi:uncharacterized protein STEHIDRAFT_46530, partial [Stereum hirsutum FP-91666 SS1]|uniref:uncharacterized protein n=1 Tax=Stereum hirsutum (strain FP-91666) TaxID=721885 RepID=UPI000440BA98
HSIGTVAMLPREMGGAVGSDLKLYGPSNVRVVNSSIMPIQLSAHLSATVYDIAEKVAQVTAKRRSGLIIFIDDVWLYQAADITQGCD